MLKSFFVWLFFGFIALGVMLIASKTSLFLGWVVMLGILGCAVWLKRNKENQIVLRKNWQIENLKGVPL